MSISSTLNFLSKVFLSLAVLVHIGQMSSTEIYPLVQDWLSSPLPLPLSHPLPHPLLGIPPDVPTNTPDLPTTSDVMANIPSSGQSAYSEAPSLLSPKAKAGLAGLGALGLGYSFYRGKLWLNQSKVSKKYMDLIKPLKNRNRNHYHTNLNYLEDINTIIVSFIKDQPQYKEALKQEKNLQSEEEILLTRFPVTVLKIELEQAIDSLGSDSWIALMRGDKSIEDLKRDLNLVLEKVKESLSYIGEINKFAEHQLEKLAAASNKDLQVCESKVSAKIKEIKKLMRYKAITNLDYYLPNYSGK